MAAISGGNEFKRMESGGQEELRRLMCAGRLTPELARRIAQGAAADLMAHRQADSSRLADATKLLCEIATLPGEALSAPGLKALFSLVVEPLADSFEPLDCAIYDAAFTQVVQFCRRLPAGRALDEALNQFTLRSEHDFLKRRQRITQMKEFDLSQAGRVKKALLLSRVTLGADVEITSIIWQKLMRVFPAADIILLAGEKAGELFGGDSRFRLHPLQYDRGGGLIDRLASWLNVVEAVAEETRGFDPDEFLIVDPDSRLTQLGLLPVSPYESRYYFFESRSYQRPGLASLGQLTAKWVNEVFGEGQPLVPCVCLRREDKAFAEAFCGKIRSSSASRLISLNFGVGNNSRKRIPDRFEEELVLSLLQDGAIVLLDKGAGANEAARIDAIVKAVRRQGKRVIEVNEGNAPELLQASEYRTDAVTWQGGIGRFSALVAETDQYVGYDSAGQHIAAALGIPTLVIFAAPSSPRFVDRWQPAGRAKVKVMRVDGPHVDRSLVPEHLVEEIRHEVSHQFDH